MTLFLISGEPFPNAHRLYINFGDEETDVISIELTLEELEELYNRVGNYLIQKGIKNGL
jgi:hypothetical protein